MTRFLQIEELDTSHLEVTATDFVRAFARVTLLFAGMVVLFTAMAQFVA